MHFGEVWMILDMISDSLEDLDSAWRRLKHSLAVVASHDLSSLGKQTSNPSGRSNEACFMKMQRPTS
jgi:hypothetical protein